MMKIDENDNDDNIILLLDIYYINIYKIDINIKKRIIQTLRHKKYIHTHVNTQTRLYTKRKKITQFVEVPFIEGFNVTAPGHGFEIFSNINLKKKYSKI